MQAAATVDERTQLRRAVIASTVGTSIEWYDFFLYSTATGLVFAKLFFPTSDPAVATLNVLLVYAVGFIARPIGAAIFGHYGDRIGRKATLIATLLLMGVATFLIGFVPGYKSIGGWPAIGIWGAIVLVVLRFVQGVGVGGEWGGSVLLSMEWGHRGRRGFWASWPQFGVPVGLVLANGALYIMSKIAGPEGFLTWGWRVPFYFSILLVAVGLYVRLRVFETPLFQRLLDEKRIEPAPVGEVIRRNWREILQSAFLRTSEQAPFYVFTAYIFIYAVSPGPLKQTRDYILLALTCAAVVSFISIPFFGYLSDVIGRKRVYIGGVLAMGIWGFIYYGLLDTKAAPLIFLAILLSLIPHDAQYGPQAALIAESYTGRLRYSGASIGYQLASIFAGGPAPIIAALLFAGGVIPGTKGIFGAGGIKVTGYHTSVAIAVYIAICAVISLIAVATVKERSKQDISAEYDEVPAAAMPVGAPTRA
ncbi:MAG TPA: MFS transporter [Candidatus Dormibacteraeota bacterium]|nr:MFS transporter [Candidatus Dormibacteraeota bacterium]